MEFLKVDLQVFKKANLNTSNYLGRIDFKNRVRAYYSDTKVVIVSPTFSIPATVIKECAKTLKTSKVKMFFTFDVEIGSKKYYIKIAYK